MYLTLKKIEANLFILNMICENKFKYRIVKEKKKGDNDDLSTKHVFLYI